MSWIGDTLAVFDRVLGADAHQKRQRVRLLGSLLDDKSKGATGIRSLDTLTRKTGMTPDACRALLSEMGCARVTLADDREGWKRTDT
ncbi:MAG: hypothetical protein AAF601_05395 [Pseudomonadota bacterium]